MWLYQTVRSRCATCSKSINKSSEISIRKGSILICNVCSSALQDRIWLDMKISFAGVAELIFSQVSMGNITATHGRMLYHKLTSETSYQERFSKIAREKLSNTIEEMIVCGY